MKKEKITIKDLLRLASGNVDAEVILASNSGAYVRQGNCDEYMQIKHCKLVCDVVFTEGDALHTATKLELAFLRSKYPKTDFTYTVGPCIIKNTYTGGAQVIDEFKKKIQDCEGYVEKIRNDERYTTYGKECESRRYIERIQEYKEIIEFCEADKYQEELTEYLAKQKSAPSVMIAINN